MKINKEKYIRNTEKNFEDLIEDFIMLPLPLQ